MLLRDVDYVFKEEKKPGNWVFVLSLQYKSAIKVQSKIMCD